MQNKEELPMASTRPERQLPLDFPNEDPVIERAQEPQGGQSCAAVLGKPALTTLPSDLMEQVVEVANMEAAWKAVKANRGAPGVDGMTIAEFPDFIRPHWPQIRQQLLDGSYRPRPARRKAIAKEDGSGERLLGIPCVLDRVIQQAVLQVLTPIFDPTFSESSFGFRPQRSAHGAVKQVKRYIKQGYRMAVDMDLSKFFDRVQHDVLMSRLARRIGDKRLLRLIGRYLRAGVMVEGLLQATEEGTPQGGPLSPLLANVLLDDLDKELERRGLRFARYADDFLILVKTHRSARQVFQSVERFLTHKLKLVVNQQKSQVANTNRVTFLGFRFVGHQIRITEKKVAKFKRRVRQITGRSRGISMERRLGELRRYLRGWIGYFALSETKALFVRLDEWIRRRVRMCYWKQWRYPRTRIRKLLELGVRREVAISHGASRKGYWRLAKTLATNCGMTNKWLLDQGLVFLRYLWGELAPLRRTA
jgi:RNA-directed DNA polymerase